MKAHEVVRHTSINTLTGCLEFTGGLTVKGYGSVRVSGRMKTAHRAVWEFEHGPIPAGMYVCHKCDNPRCVRIDHLFLGTPADNRADMVAKGRARYARGEAHGKSKLTSADVAAIRRMKADGAIQRHIARHFGMSEPAISAIIRGAHWKECV